MPKEVVRGPDGSPAVQVGWDPAAGQVQVTSHNGEPALSGQPSVLDRPGINHLIVALRRARNAVFGQDA